MMFRQHFPSCPSTPAPPPGCCMDRRGMLNYEAALPGKALLVERHCMHICTYMIVRLHEDSYYYINLMTGCSLRFSTGCGVLHDDIWLQVVLLSGFVLPAGSHGDSSLTVTVGCTRTESLTTTQVTPWCHFVFHTVAELDLHHRPPQCTFL